MLSAILIALGIAELLAGGPVWLGVLLIGLGLGIVFIILEL